MRYRASSRSRTGVSHLVDLLEGQCTCEYFEYNRTECPHMRAAYLKLGRTFAALVRQEVNKHERNKE